MQQIFQNVIIGAGPGGTGPLVCAARRGQLDELLQRGLAIVDRRAALGNMVLGEYAIPSNSLGRAFLECLDDPCPEVLLPLRDSPQAQAIEPFRETELPLKLVGDFLDRVVEIICQHVEAHPNASMLAGFEAQSLHIQADDSIEVRGVRGGEPTTLKTKRVVFAMGGDQTHADVVSSEIFTGLDLTGPVQDRVMLSDTFLRDKQHLKVVEQLANNKRVVIVGGSHTALSIAWQLLNKFDIDFNPGDIRILHRTPVRVFYPDAASAAADGYDNVTQADMCPQTQQVNRIGGLRGPARELFRAIRAGNEERVQTIQVSEAQQVRQHLDEAALVVPAFGYQKNVVPIYDPSGTQLKVLDGLAPPTLDSGRLCTLDGRILDSICSIGLGSGFRSSAAIGGEASYQASVEGVWLYQNDIGSIILEQLLR